MNLKSVVSQEAHELLTSWLKEHELAERAGYEPSTGHVTNTLSALRTKGLITKGYPVCIADELMSA